MDSYKEVEEEVKSRGSATDKEEMKSIPEKVKELIQACASLKDEEEDLLSGKLNELSQYCKYNFSKAPLAIDFKSNLEIIINFLENESAKVCCSALKVLRCFASFYPNDTKPILDNALVLFPMKMFKENPKISFVFKKELIKSLTKGLTIMDDSIPEKEPFNLDLLLADEEDDEEEDFDIEKYLINSLELVKELAKNQWPMDNDFEEICEFIEDIFMFFENSGLKNGKGQVACDIIVQTFTHIVCYSQNVEAEPIVRILQTIQSFFFFEDEGSRSMNLTFVSLLNFYIVVANKLPNEVAKEIYSKISFSEIVSYAVDDTNQLLHRAASLFTLKYVDLLPDKCAEEFMDEIERFSLILINMLHDSLYRSKILAAEFYVSLFNKSDLFSSICALLVENDEFLNGILLILEAEDEKLSKIGASVITKVSELYPDSHEKLLSIFGDLLDDPPDYLEDFVRLLSDVMVDDGD